MQLFVNGETREIENVTTVAELVATLHLEASRIAIERNRAIVPRSTYTTATLNEGDRIEIVQFIGGG